MTHKPPQHNAEKISPDSEGRVKEEFKKLIDLASAKVSFFMSDDKLNLHNSFRFRFATILLQI